MSQGTREEQPKQSSDDSELGPNGPRRPYPIGEPIGPRGSGSEPDYFPGKPGGGSPKVRPVACEGEANPRQARLFVSWHQAH